MARVEFLYVRPDELWSLNATVALTAGTVDSDYLAAWLCDGRPGRPVRTTAGTATFRVTNTAAEVGLVAVCNHNLDVASIAVTEDVTATITNPSLPPNGIRLNPFKTVTPVSSDQLDFAISGNGSDIVIGEIVAGKYRTLPRFGYQDDDTSHDDYERSVDVDLASVPPYDPGIKSRVWKGSVILTTAQRDLVIAWHEAQRSGTRPSLIVPVSTVNDAWLVRMRAPTYRPVGPDLWRVELEFHEYPRSRW